MKIDLGDFTSMPCGRDCGVFYNHPGLVDPAKIQQAALADGWKIITVKGDSFIACDKCYEKWMDKCE